MRPAAALQLKGLDGRPGPPWVTGARVPGRAGPGRAGHCEGRQAVTVGEPAEAPDARRRKSARLKHPIKKYPL